MVNINFIWIIFINISHSTIKSKTWDFRIFELIDIFYVKILCLAIFFAFFFRQSNEDKEANEYIDDHLNNDEEYLHSNKVCLIRRRKKLRNDYSRCILDFQFVQNV